MTDRDVDAAEAASGISRTWRESPPAVKAVVAGMLVNRLGGFLQVFLALFLVHDGYSSVRAGIALSAYAVGSVLGVLAGGWLVARIGVRLSVLGSMTATAVLTASLLYASPYPLILVIAAAVGATSQVYRPASGELVGRLTPEGRQVMVFAMYRLATNVGATAAPLLGAALLAGSYTFLFWSEAAAALGCALIGGFALPHDRPAPTTLAAPEQPPPLARTAGRGPRTGYTALLLDRRYLLFLLAMLGYATVYTQYLSTLPLTLRHLGMSTWVYSGLVAVNGAVVISCELLVTTFVQHWPARLATVLGILLAGVGVSAYALPWGVAGLVAATLLWSLGETVCAPTMVAYPAKAAPEHLRSRYLGASQAMFGVGSAAGPAAGVAVWSLCGNAVWPLCGAVALASALVAAVAMPRSKPAPTPLAQPARRSQSPHR